MMNLPQLPQAPTDNLYKFMAVFGLTLVLVGVILPVYVEHLRVVSQAEVTAKLNSSSLDMMLAGESQALKDLSEKNIPEDPQEREKFNRKITDFVTRAVRDGNEIQMFEAKNSFVTIVRIGSIVLLTIGLILIFKGFSLWQKKLQKYQDIIVRNQAKMSRIEILNVTKVKRTTDVYQNE